MLVQKIDSGEYQQNELIPQEFKLMEEFGVSRITVRNALSLLVNEGYLQRTPGRGTTVMSRKSNLSKLRKGMTFGMFILAEWYSNSMVSSLLTGLNEYEANLCIFPFRSGIDQLYFFKETLAKNIVDGVFLGYFSEWHEQVVKHLKRIEMPFLSVADLTQYESFDINYPRLSIDEVSPLTNELQRYFNQGVRRLQILGTVHNYQMRRIRILLKLTGIADKFEQIYTDVEKEDDYFTAARHVMASAVNRPDTLVIISGDELLPSYDAVFATMPCFSREAVNTIVYHHGGPWMIRYDYFERPYEDFGHRAASMMQTIMNQKEENGDIYTPDHVLLDAFIVRAKQAQTVDKQEQKSKDYKKS